MLGYSPERGVPGAFRSSEFSSGEMAYRTWYRGRTVMSFKTNEHKLMKVIIGFPYLYSFFTLVSLRLFFCFLFHFLRSSFWIPFLVDISRQTDRMFERDARQASTYINTHTHTHTRKVWGSDDGEDVVFWVVTPCGLAGVCARDHATAQPIRTTQIHMWVDG
jgi:hypothetical protein